MPQGTPRVVPPPLIGQDISSRIPRTEEAANTAPALRCVQNAALRGVVKANMTRYATRVTIGVSSHVFVPVPPPNDTTEGMRTMRKPTTTIGRFLPHPKDR